MFTLNFRFRCKEPINDLRTDFGCVKDIIMDHGINESLILATGNKDLKRLMTKYSDVPIIYIRNHEVLLTLKPLLFIAWN